MQYLVHTLERVPRQCVWEITNRCNLRCVHCECEAGDAHPEELSTDEALALASDLAALGTETVNLSGGEPLLRRDWPLIAERLAEHGVAVHLVTNGLAFDQRAARRCLDAGVRTVAISIDGPMATHDSIRRYPRGEGPSRFRRAYEALALACSTGLSTVVITHINGRNQHELAELHALLALLPIGAWQLQLGCPQGRMLSAEPSYLVAPEALPAIAQLVADLQGKPFRILCTDDIGYYTEHEAHLRPLEAGSFPFFLGCYAGILGVAIESDGGIKGCPSLPSSLVDANVRQRSLRDIWEDPASFPYTRRFDARKLRGFCRRCEFRRLCRAGCTSFALASTGSIYEDRHCLYRVQQCRS